MEDRPLSDEMKRRVLAILRVDIRYEPESRTYRVGPWWVSPRGWDLSWDCRFTPTPATASGDFVLAGRR